jgi:hypothetical protein
MRNYIQTNKTQRTMKKSDVIKCYKQVKEVLLNTFEATETDRQGELKVNTRFGTLLVNTHEPHSNGVVCSIFTRFETPTEEAQYFTGCGHTGKVNFHEYNTNALFTQWYGFIQSIYEPSETSCKQTTHSHKAA